MGKGAIPGRALIRCLAVMAATTGLGGCSSGRATPAGAGGDRIEVVASVFPLAELARRIGLDRVRVTDLSAPASDPRTITADPTTVSALDRARAVLLVGGGFQPDLERAALGRPNLVSVWAALGGVDPHVWLDPIGMEQLATLVAGALSTADPAGRAGYQTAASVYRAQLGSLDIDYRTSLADCAHRDLVTADGAFAAMAGRYGLISHTVADPGIAQLVAGGAVGTIFTEPLVPPGPAEALAGLAHVKTESLDTLETRSATQLGRGASYLSLMTDNLAKLRVAQACTSASPN